MRSASTIWRVLTGGDPAEVASVMASHLAALHWIRDTVYEEDASKASIGNGPQIKASLRNLAIGALRLAGRCTFAEATRWAARRPERPFMILGLSS